MRTSSLLNRLKVALNFVMYGRSNAQIMTCGKCGRIAISSISSQPYETHQVDSVHADLCWAQSVRCKCCGSVCIEVQLWDYKGDIRNIDTATQPTSTLVINNIEKLQEV